MALPGSGKSFDQFRGDDVYCKQYALEQVEGTTANQASVRSGVGTAALGTLVGAAAGAAFGGAEGVPSWDQAPPGPQGISGSSAMTSVIPSACTAKATAFRFQDRSSIMAGANHTMPHRNHLHPAPRRHPRHPATLRLRPRNRLAGRPESRVRQGQGVLFRAGKEQACSRQFEEFSQEFSHLLFC